MKKVRVVIRETDREKLEEYKKWCNYINTNGKEKAVLSLKNENIYSEIALSFKDSCGKEFVIFLDISDLNNDIKKDDSRISKKHREENKKAFSGFNEKNIEILYEIHNK